DSRQITRWLRPRSRHPLRLTDTVFCLRPWKAVIINLVARSHELVGEKQAGFRKPRRLAPTFLTPDRCRNGSQPCGLPFSLNGCPLGGAARNYPHHLLDSGVPGPRLSVSKSARCSRCSLLRAPT